MEDQKQQQAREAIKGLKYSQKFLSFGFTGFNGEEWPHAKKAIILNGQTFDYSLGSAHINFMYGEDLKRGFNARFFIKESLNGSGIYNMGRRYDLGANTGFGSTIIESLKSIGFEGEELKNRVRDLSYYEVGWDGKLCPVAVVRWTKIEEFLNNCFIDSVAIDFNFQDWCGEFSYSPDSIKAKKIYRECQEAHFKLKKALGSDYELIKEYIQFLGI